MLNLKPKQLGFSLIEFMIGIFVGLIVLWGLSTVYINSYRGSKVANTANQLNQDLRAVTDIMVNDIRRAGYGTSSTGVSIFSAANTNLEINTAGTCILYSYDATFAGGTAGIVDNLDIMGFRLSGGVIQTLVPAALANTSTSTPCAGTAVWENLTDSRAITVTSFSIDTTGSKCIAYLPATYDSADASTFTTWTTTSGNGPACISTASNAPSTYPSATNTFVETRQVNITLTAQSVTDASLVRTLTEKVLVRNNRIIAP